MSAFNRSIAAALLAIASTASFAGEITEITSPANWPDVTVNRAASASEIRWIDNQTGFTIVPGPASNRTQDVRGPGDFADATFA